MIRRLFASWAICTLVVSGCSSEIKASAAQPRVEKKEGSVPPRVAVVTASATPYRVIAIAGGGSIQGTVDFEGVIPRDTAIQLGPEHVGCGRSIVDEQVQNSGTRIGGAVVWLADIREGKPLGTQRRFELSNAECAINPRVQAVFAPGTLNVTSEDVAMHRNRIINVATGETEAIAPFNDNGEVVPFDKLLTRPSQYEVTCDLHPWSKAWIIVYDHPYYSVSSSTGAFSIDNVPPGTYQLKAWHPVLGVVEQSVTVASGQNANVVLKLAGEAAAAPQPRAAAAPTPSA